MTDEIHAEPNPWHPMKDSVDLKVMGKLIEELGECTAAASRCLIQGIDEVHPITGKPNRDWLEDEIADVLAGLNLTVQRFDLNISYINTRQYEKQAQLKKWHDLA